MLVIPVVKYKIYISYSCSISAAKRKLLDMWDGGSQLCLLLFGLKAWQTVVENLVNTPETSICKQTHLRSAKLIVV